MEPKNINVNIDKLLVPVGNVQSQKPVTAESGSIRTRVRYSGAARRRYKKLMQRGELPVRTRKLPPTRVISRSKNKEYATINTRINKPKDDTPIRYFQCDALNSPSNHLSERPKTPDQEPPCTRAEITKIAFVLEGYPDRKLGADEVRVVKKLIRERILELPEDALVPTFINTRERDGVVIFNCANKPSVDWLKNLSTEIKIENTSLHVLPADELPKRHWVVVHIEELDLTIEEIIKLLDKQNAGLVARDWIIVKRSESRDEKSVHFSALIGDSSLEALKACGFKPFCGLNQATVKLFDKDHEKSTKETTYCEDRLLKK